MNLPTIVASLALVVIVAWAVYHIVSNKKRGGACLGCPVEGTCPTVRAYCGSASRKTEVTIQPYKAHASAALQAKSHAAPRAESHIESRAGKTASTCQHGCNHAE